MKELKRYLWGGLFSAGMGAVLLAAGVFAMTGTLGSLVCGMGGGCLGSGLMQLRRYAKWHGNEQAFREYLEQERIDLQDERKEMLRDKAGRYTYLLGLAVCFLGAFLTALLGALGVVEHYLPVLLLLAGLGLFQYIAGVWIYRRLSRKF